MRGYTEGRANYPRGVCGWLLAMGRLYQKGVLSLPIRAAYVDQYTWLKACDAKQRAENPSEPDIDKKQAEFKELWAKTLEIGQEYLCEDTITASSLVAKWLSKNDWPFEGLVEIEQSDTPEEVSEPKYEFFPKERTIRIGCLQFDRMTPKMVEILSVFVEQYEKGFPVVDLVMIRNRTKYRFDGSFLPQAFKQNRKGEPPMHPEACLIMRVSDGKYRLMDSKEVKNKVPE